MCEQAKTRDLKQNWLFTNHLIVNLNTQKTLINVHFVTYQLVTTRIPFVFITTIIVALMEKIFFRKYCT